MSNIGPLLAQNNLADVSNPQNAIGNLAGVTFVSSIAALQSLPAHNATASFEGYIFAWNAANLSAQIAVDTQMGIYVPPTSDPTGASGAWVRQFTTNIEASWFGVADGSTVDAAIACAVAVTSQFFSTALSVRGGTFTLASTWTIASAITIFFFGSNFVAKSGFTAKNLFVVTSNNVKLYGYGTFDGTNLPAITAPFDGTDFTGITALVSNNPTAPINGTEMTGIVIDGEILFISGSCGALTAYFCYYIQAHRLQANGTASSATYAAAPLLYFHGTNGGQFSNLTSLATKWKGISFETFSYLQASNLYVETTAIDQAAIYANNIITGSIQNAVSKGGFGFKADLCTDLDASINIDCSNNGIGGAIIQGGNRIRLRGNIKNFKKSGSYSNSYGCAIQYDPSGFAIDHDIDVDIETTGVQGDDSCGFYLVGNGTYGISGLKLKGRISGSDIGIFAYSSGAIFARVVCDIDFYNIQSYIGTGPFIDLSVTGGSCIDSANLLDGWKVGSNLSADFISVDGFKMNGCGTAATLLNLSTLNGAVNFNTISINNCTQNGCAALLSVNLASGNGVKVLTATGNTGVNLSGADGIYLSNANGSADPIQVMMSGNTLLGTDYATKKNINFVQTAASGAFNGIATAALNMAIVLNAPNNV